MWVSKQCVIRFCLYERASCFWNVTRAPLLSAVVYELADVVKVKHAVKLLDFARKQYWLIFKKRNSQLHVSIYTWHVTVQFLTPYLGALAAFPRGPQCALSAPRSPSFCRIEQSIEQSRDRVVDSANDQRQTYSGEAKASAGASAMAACIWTSDVTRCRFRSRAIAAKAATCSPKTSNAPTLTEVNRS